MPIVCCAMLLGATRPSMSGWVYCLSHCRPGRGYGTPGCSRAVAVAWGVSLINIFWETSELMILTKQKQKAGKMELRELTKENVLETV